jgi:acyl transferase domain-containing protein/glutamate-1-semialdehyde aminotransferase
MIVVDPRYEGRIAIIGMAGRFPGAPNLDAFWKNLVDGVESINFFSDTELLESGLDPATLAQPNCVKARGMLGDVELFDAGLFNFTRREAELMDPQQRLILECAWEALENAGYDPEQWRGSIGVFAGASHSTYLPIVRRHLNPERQVSEFELAVANNKDYLTTRVSYKLGLRGPSIAVQTACSTSLVAVHLACQSLLLGQCDLALAGGVSVYLPEKTAHLHQEGGIASPDGHCRAFDALAAGTIGGNGVGLVVLKPLAAAIADRDHIRAIVLGSAINNDGRLKAGYTAPSIEGQAEVIAEAMAVSSVAPETITYVEAHGTGTPLGDPIEVAALTQAFRSETKASGFCALGSVKTNIGHLDAAAGVAGLIKTVLALENKVLPASLHFKEPNPKIDFENTPFHVNARSQPWTAAVPRRAGVSSFGIGGTNAHVIVEEATGHPVADSQDPWHLLVLSANSEGALSRSIDRLREYLRRNPQVNLADLAFTLQVGRRALRRRAVLVCRDFDDALDGLSEGSPRRITGIAGTTSPPIVMMFPGQGAQHPRMGADLYAAFPVFRETVDRCCGLLESILRRDLRQLIYPALDETSIAAVQLAETAVAQPALSIIEYALAKLWMAWGIMPHSMIGHSVGEYVAACLSGVFAEDDVLRLLATRGRLVQELPGGSMLAVSIPEDRITSMLGPDLSVAAVNGPARCVVAGPPDAVGRLAAELADRGVLSTPLKVSHAFHSPVLDRILPVFKREVARLTLRPPTIPFISNVTGTWIAAADATNPHYWVRHLRETVRFSRGLGEVCQRTAAVLLEVGPRRTLSSLAKQHPESADHLVLNSLCDSSDGRSDALQLLETLGRLWLAGVQVNWSGLYSVARRRIPAPSYPFERERFWIASKNGRDSHSARTRQPAATPAVSGGERPMSGLANSASAKPTHSTRLLLQSLLAELIGRPFENAEQETSFVEIGLDSLLLMQFCRAIQQTFGVQVGFRQLLDELPTLRSLAEHLDQVSEPRGATLARPDEGSISIPPVKASDPLQSPLQIDAADQQQSASSHGLGTRPDGGNGLHSIILEQIALLSRQLSVLERDKREAGSSSTDGVPRLSVSPTCTVVRSEDQNQPSPTVQPQHLRAAEVARFGPWCPVSPNIVGALSSRQRQHLDRLIERYTKRRCESKRLAEEHRPHFADGIASVGFRLATKEIVYPIVAARSEGSRIWDVDGNEYIDFVMGFGVNLFGHRPPFVTTAIEDQLRLGVHLGPQCTHTGEVAEMICELTGAERVAFCNSGSEAVMGALRLARTVTGRTKIALFAGSYHGMYDGVLARSRRGEPSRSQPVAPGIPQAMIEGVIVLDYGTPESLAILRREVSDLAAVLVEPVQSARPACQPGDFLRELRRLASDGGAVLIFDEMITGFRIHPGGAQAWFGVQADLSTYGKIIGGGLPIGVIAGKASCMDALDGGSWRFGDDSYPRANQTFFAGTFAKHPLAMAAASAVLKQLKASGPGLQRNLNDQTARLVRALTIRFESAHVPIRVSHFGSLFRLDMPTVREHLNLLTYHLIEKGFYIGDRSAFLSTAHSERDIDRFVEAVEESVVEMRDAGFLAEVCSSPYSADHISIESGCRADSAGRAIAGSCAQGGPAGEQIAHANAKTVEMTDAQKGLWALTQLGPEASRAYNESATLRLRGGLDVVALRTAVQQVVARHEALRTAFAVDGTFQHIVPTLKVDVPLIDLRGRDRDSRWREAMERVACEISEPFVLSQRPLIRIQIIHLAAQHHLMCIVMPHIVTDGWSLDVFLQELSALYRAACEGQPAQLTTPVQFTDFARQRVQQHSADFAAAEAYWLEQFVPPVPTLELPTDRPRSGVQTYRGAREQLVLTPTTRSEFKNLSSARGATLYMGLLAAFEIALHQLTGQDDIVVGIHAAAQPEVAGIPEKGGRPMMGFCVNLLPLRSRISAESTFAEQLASAKNRVLGAHRWQMYALSRLVKRLDLKRDPARPPLVSAIFNLDHLRSRLVLHGLDVEFIEEPVVFARFDLLWNIVESEDGLFVCSTYNADLFDRSTILRWMTQYEALLLTVIHNPNATYAELREAMLCTAKDDHGVATAEAADRVRADK